MVPEPRLPCEGTGQREQAVIGFQFPHGPEDRAIRTGVRTEQQTHVKGDTEMRTGLLRNGGQDRFGLVGKTREAPGRTSLHAGQRFGEHCRVSHGASSAEGEVGGPSALLEQHCSLRSCPAVCCLGSDQYQLRLLHLTPISRSLTKSSYGFFFFL